METSLYQITDDALLNFSIPEVFFCCCCYFVVVVFLFFFFSLYLIWIFLFAVHFPITLAWALFTI